MGGSPKRLEAVPYTVVNLTRQRPEGNPLLSPSAGEMAIGLDVKYAVTPGLTLTATVNPDFGQVEADPAVVNLSAFETFFAERRPFFVEGSGNFNFDADCWDGAVLDCSTRGASAARRTAPTICPTATTSTPSYPTQSTILGAAKLTGRVGKFSVGAMYAVTAGGNRRPIVDGTVRSQQAVEPTTSYAIGRMRREFANQSSIGVHGDVDQPQAAGRAAISCRAAATPAASTSTRDSGSATASLASSRPAASTAQRRRSNRCRRTAGTITSGRTPCRSRSIRHAPR